jgi:hypothetical protein
MRLIRTRALAVALTALVAAAPLASASSLAKPPAAALELINPIELRQHVEFLASPEVGGRYSLSPGLKIAARYLASRLESYGFRGAGEGGSYYQPFDLVKRKVKAEGSSLKLTVDGKTAEYGYGEFASLEPVKADVEGPIVFAGYGVSAPELNHDDYKGLDVKDKVVLLAPGTPKAIEDSSKLKPQQTGAAAAAAHGAKAVISLPPLQYSQFVKSPEFKTFVLNYEGVGLDKPADASIPAVFLPPAPADHLLSALDLSLDTVWKMVNDRAPMEPRAISASADLSLEVAADATKAQNVVAILEGTDPKLKDEYISLSAHYDHVKTNSKGEIYPGADDDASGTAAVLALAKAYALERPKRSVLVIFHAAEELGLLGSEYNADVSPVVPLDKMVVNLNIDMIGRSRAEGDTDKRNAELTDANSIYIIGSDKISTELHEINELTNKELTKLRFDYTYNDPNHPQQFYYRSDHWNYAKHGIPIIFYFSGVHADYHQPSDTPDKIDYQKMTKVTRLIYATGWRIANLDHRLKVDAK